MNQKRKLRSLLAGVIALVMVFSLAMPTVFADSTAEKEETATEPKNGAYYASDYETVEEMQADNAATVRQMAAEGTVLLKNEGNVLPLAKGSNVTVLGKNSVNPFYLGTGSGSATNYDGLEQKKISIYDSLVDVGLHYNPAMKAFFEDASLSGAGRPTGGQGSGMPQWSERCFGWPVGETTAEQMKNAPSSEGYQDAAIVVLTRIGGEGYDLPRSSWDYNRGTDGMNRQDDFSHFVVADENGIPKAVEGRTVYDAETGLPATKDTEVFFTENYLQLDDNERDMLRYANENFETVIVLVNSANAMDLSELNDPEYGVDGALWCSFPGFLGFPGVMDVLSGAVAPSGGLVDTYLKDLRLDPTYYNAAAGDSSIIRKADMLTAEEDIGVPEKNSLIAAGTNYYSLFGLTAYILSEDYTVTDLPAEEGGLGPIASGLAENDYVYKAGDFSYNRFIKYKEGIFMGYRYYETVRAELNKLEEGKGDEWYGETVMYPFGYGLSYTSFEKTIKSIYTTGHGADTKVNMQITVTNTGSVAAKTPVQVYVKPAEGEVNKAAIQLVAFDKSKVLQPGETQYLDISVDVYHFASFDQTGSGYYVVEAGDYAFVLGNEFGVAGAAASEGGVLTLPEIKFADAEGNGVDPDTGYTVTNRYYDYNVVEGKNQIEGEVIQRTNIVAADGTVNLPKADTIEERTVDGAFIQEVYDAEFVNQLAVNDDPSDPWYNDNDPREVPGVNVATAKDDPIEITVTAADLVGLSFEHEKFDTFLNEMTLQELGTLLESTTTGGVPRLGLPASRSGDGPQGFGYGGNLGGRFDGVGHIWFPSEALVAATWNAELPYRQGRLVGNDGVWSQITHWLAPGANTHRNAFSGRNYEYFSEDPVLSGVMLANTCKGAREMGLVVCVKHFAINDQETDRQTISDAVLTYVDEQTAREIYFKPFEIAVKMFADEDLGCNGLMTSFNRLGKQWIGSIYGVNVEMLRNEWGFVGRLVSDASDRHMLADIALRGGQESMLSSGGVYRPSYTTSSDYDKMTATQLNLLRWAAKNVVYASVNSNAMNQNVCYVDEHGDFVTTDTYYTNEELSQEIEALKAQLEELRALIAG